MIIIQKKELINNLMKRYINVSTSLTTFLKAFKSILK